MEKGLEICTPKSIVGFLYNVPRLNQNIIALFSTIVCVSLLVEFYVGEILCNCGMWFGFCNNNYPPMSTAHSPCQT